ncbi:putative BAHD family acyltransferase [Violaceomyces palustris]|uniref:BAHD family acyltransferase n=1 Tax=Violaceomyces palustris TaxID=1673888 RepID=A0ACD0NS01_9BASI|nr:putative BAHD family acyltransferase [Violaceomyces palustris]
MTVVPETSPIMTVSVERVRPDPASSISSLPDSVLIDGQDLAMPKMYMHCTWFFLSLRNPHLTSKTLPELGDILRKGLASFLSEYPAAAGQVGQEDDVAEGGDAVGGQGRWRLYYSGQGADLYLAESDQPLGEAWKCSGAKVDEAIAPRSVVIAKDQDPVFAIKLTRFACGSFTISTSTHHWVADFLGYLDIMEMLGRKVADPEVRLPSRNWSRNASELVESIPPSPIPHQEWFKERSKQGLGTSPSRPIQGCRNLLLRFEADQLEKLKTSFGRWALEAEGERKTEDEGREINVLPSKEHWISTNDALHALLWSAITRARGLEGDKVTKLHTPLDGRAFVPRSIHHPDGPYVGNLHPGHVMKCNARDVAVDKARLFELAYRIRNDCMVMDSSRMSAIIRHHNYRSDAEEGGKGATERRFGAGYLPNQNAMFGDDVTISNIAKVDWRSRLDFGHVLGKPFCMTVLGVPAIQLGPLVIRAGDGTALVYQAPPTDPEVADEVSTGSKKVSMLAMVGLREQEIAPFLQEPLVKEFAVLV